MPASPDLIAAWKDLNAARPAYEQAEAFYCGDVDEVYASDKVRRLLQQARATQIEEFNYCHIPVDTVANRLRIVSITIVDDEGQAPDEGEPLKAAKDGGASARGVPVAKTTPAKANDQKSRDPAPAEDVGPRPGTAAAALETLWATNELDAQSIDLHRKVSRHGDCYLIVWPRTDDAGKVAGVDVRVSSALTTRMIYDDDDPLKALYAIKSWSYEEHDDKGRATCYTRATLYYPDRVERWVSEPDAKGPALGEPDAWLPYRGDGDPVVEHDYGMVVFHFRNDRQYGHPEHLFAYGPQQMLNKLIAAQSSAIDYQSFPQRYALMDPTADQPMGNLLDPVNPHDDDDPEGEGNTTGLSAEASSVWRFWGAKTVGQFDPASPDTFLKPFDRYVQAMAELTETPLYRFGSAFAATPSGAALRVADAPTVNKVTNRQDSYDPPWEDSHELALRMLGFRVQVKVNWEPAEQVTDYEGWSVVQAKIAAGVPRRQVLVETGYSPQQVDEWLGKDAPDEEDLRRKVDLLTAIAGAAQQLGAAQAMGVMSKEAVAAVMAKVLGDDPAVFLPDENAQPAPDEEEDLVPAGEGQA